MADTTAELGIAVKVTGGNDLDVLNKKLKETADNKDQLDFKFSKPIAGQGDFGFADSYKKATDSVRTSVTATGQSMNWFQKIFKGIFGGADSDMGRGSEATRQFRDALHVMNPVLVSAGMGFSGLGIFSRAATAGIAGLALAIGASFAVVLERLGDKADVARRKLEGLFPGQGNNLWKQAGQSAADAEVSFNTVLDTLTQIGNVQQTLRQSSTYGIVNASNALYKEPGSTATPFMPGMQGGPFRYAPDDTSATNKQVDAAGALAAAYKIAGLRADDAKKATDQLFGSLTKIGEKGPEQVNLTTQAFNDFQKAVGSIPADMLAKALNLSNADELMKKLVNGAKFTASDIIAGFARMHAELQAQADKTQETLGQSWDRLGASWDRLMARLGAPHPAAQTLGGLANAADELVRILDKGAQANFEAYSTRGQNAFNSLEFAARKAMLSVVDSVMKITQSVINGIKNLAAATPISMIGGAVSGGGPSFTVPAGGINLGGGDTGNYGDLTSLTGPYSAGYATGGGFTVGGDQAVNFMATSGERVTVAPPNGATSSFIVQGESGIDKVPVGFSAPSGTVVTIAPASDSSGGYPAFGNVGFAPGHTATTSSRSAAMTAAVQSPQSVLDSLSQFGIPIPPGIAALLSGSAASPFLDLIQGAIFSAQHGGAQFASGSVEIKGGAGGWSGRSYGNFQGGGQFVVGGGKAIGGDKGGGDINIHVYGVSDAGSFIASMSQIKRDAKRTLMQ